ncbi:MAG: putative phage abortive infection protein [Sulfuricurvum sp.]|nr:putative phage abortive infection protein [Sulfuricurvum sp.]
MSDNKEKNVAKKFEAIESIKWIAVILFTITLLVYFSTFPGTIPEDRGNWGVFGDFMGGTLNPILAFLSLLAIIFTIKIQTEELELTRHELEETRKEMAKSSDAQKEQSEALKAQNLSVIQQTFENTFFKLLEHHNALINDLYEYMEPDEGFSIYGKNMLILILRSDNIIMEFKKQNINIVKTYFMTLYQILKFIKIKEEQLGEEKFFNPKLYTNMVRATLDETILCLLAVNVNQQDFIKFKELLVHYNFFEHIDLDFLDLKYRARGLIPVMISILKNFDKKIYGSNKIVESIYI